MAVDYPRETTKARLMSTLKGLKDERQTFEPLWKDCADFVMPSRTRFLTNDRNKAWRRNNTIVDSTATRSLGTLQAGLHSNITSPSRYWFNLVVRDADLAENAAVKDYLHRCRELMFGVLNRSNVYQVLSQMYGDMGAFGTSVIGIFEDPKDVIRARDFPVGSFYIGLDEDGRLVVFAHETQMTVRQIVGDYAPQRGDGTRDLSRLSDQVREMWQRGGASLEHSVDIVQVIKRSDDYRPNRLESKYKEWYSCTFETSGPDDQLLEETGFEEFPIIAARWGVNSLDAYATWWPTLQCLGDIKQLQFMAKKGAKAYDKSIDPPLVASMQMRNSAIGLLPGHINYVAQTSDSQLRPLHEVRTDWQGHVNMVNDTRSSVQSAYFVDLFRMLDMLEGPPRTATEIMERREEKMQTLGPVLERLNDDVLEPLIDRVWAIMERAGLLPIAPEELEGRKIDIEYESSMSQAQKQSGVGAMERYASTMGTIAQVKPDILDKWNTDKWADEYTRALSVAPHVTHSDEDVAAVRKERAKAAMRQQIAENAPKVAGAAKTLSETDPNGGMLNDLSALGQWGGAGQNLTGVAA